VYLKSAADTALSIDRVHGGLSAARVSSSNDSSSLRTFQTVSGAWGRAVSLLGRHGQQPDADPGYLEGSYRASVARERWCIYMPRLKYVQSTSQGEISVTKPLGPTVRTDRGMSRREGVGRTRPVTIRMPAPMVEALKAEAERQGVRGYQTLMKQWLSERLNGEPLISASELGRALRQLPLTDTDLARLLEGRG
jgi:hypothetical protein